MTVSSTPGRPRTGDHPRLPDERPSAAQDGDGSTAHPDKRPVTGSQTAVRPGVPLPRRSIADLPLIEQKESRRIPWLPIVALVAMTALVVSKLWPSSVVVPRNVLGTWSTTDPRYAGRQMRIDSLEIVLDNGDEGETHGRITDVESSSDAEGLVVTIDYLEGDRESSVVLRYRGGRDEHVIVGEQRGVRWVRSGVWVNDGTPESVRPQMPDSRSAPPDIDAPVPPEAPQSPPSASDSGASR